MSEYDETREAARKATEKYGDALRNLEDGTYTLEVVDIVEHEDGSATYSFDLNEDTAVAMSEMGLKFCLYCFVAGLNTQQGLDIILSEAKEDVKGMSNPGNKDYEV